MDELTQRLKEDARAIDASISEELERRIEGALEMTRPEPPPRRPRPVEWWAVLLGLGAAAAFGAMLLLSTAAPAPEPRLPVNRPITLTFPALDPDSATEAMVDPLERELGHLLADLGRAKKALGIGFESRAP